MKFEGIPLSRLLKDRRAFAVFDEEFRGEWLDVTALLSSESDTEGLRRDKTVPDRILNRIEERLSELSEVSSEDDAQD